MSNIRVNTTELLQLLGLTRGDDPFVGEPGGHEQVVGIVVAVLDVENDFVSHTGNACELKTRAGAKSIILIRNNLSVR